MLYFDKYRISITMNPFNFPILGNGKYSVMSLGPNYPCMYLVLVDRRLDPVPHALAGAPKWNFFKHAHVFFLEIQ